MSPPQRASFRPQLEALEDRCVPSTLTVSNASGWVGTHGSLPYEIAVAHSGDTIVFGKKLGGATINLNGSELYIDKNLTIQGPAGGVTISGNFAPSPGVVDTAGTSRVFEVAPNTTVTLSGLSIIDGDGLAAGNIGSPYDGEGGGILNFGTLTLSGCYVYDNQAAYYGGGIYNAGTLTVSGGSVSSNLAEQLPDSNGTMDPPSTYGGGIYNAGTLTISGSQVSYNSADYGGGIFAGGTVTVSDSIFSHNYPNNIDGSYTDGGGNTFS